MILDISAASNALGEAVRKCGEAQGALVAVADGPINDAKEVVRMVFAAGFELPGLNEVIGRLEEHQNETHKLVSKIAAVAAKIEEARG